MRRKSGRVRCLIKQSTPYTLLCQKKVLIKENQMDGYLYGKWSEKRDTRLLVENIS